MNRISKTLTMLLTYFALACMAMGAEKPELQTQTKGQTHDVLFLTATNGLKNSLLVINTKSHQLEYILTGGSGVVSGNGGGVAVNGDLAVVVNNGSTNFTPLVRTGNTMKPGAPITTLSQPVSVAFGHDHLFELGLSNVQSFPVYGNDIQSIADGTISVPDRTGGQIVSFDAGAAYTLKSGNAYILGFGTNGAPGLTGPSIPIQLPAFPNTDTPLGIIGRGGYLYTTVAHSDLELVNDATGKLINSAIGPVPYKDVSGNLTHAPCWNALWGQFLYASDSPAHQLRRYLVSDSHVLFDKVVANLQGAPTDLAVAGNLLGVIDNGDGVNGNVSIFNIDSEGELTLRFSVKIPGGTAINGAAFVQ